MKTLIKKAIAYRVITLFITAIIACVGAVAFYLLPRQESPDVSVPVAMIVTVYPGASASDVKELVSKKIEDRLVELSGYDHSKGVSKKGVSIVTVWFKSSAPKDKAMQDVRNVASDVKTELPSGVTHLNVNTDMSESAGIIISLSGKAYSYEQLESFADRFKNKLQDIEGISKAKVVGKMSRQVDVTIDIGKLNALSLSIEDVCKILAAQNVQIPAGSIDYASGKLSVDVPGQYQSIEQIQNTVIGVSTDTGVVTRLKDIAEIKMGYETDAMRIKHGDESAVLLTGYFVNEKNIVIVGKNVRTAINSVKADLPEDLQVDEVIYQPDAVSRSTNEFMFHLCLGVLLVVIIVMLNMGIRNALIVSATIPLSMLATFSVMYAKGMQIHQISLTALIIALGMLVDDAIVVCDTIQVKLDEGKSREEAAYEGATRSTIPILSATTAIIVAFLPLLGIPGEAGEFLKAIPVGLIISISASYLVAMFVIPALMAMFARPALKGHGGSTKWLSQVFIKLLHRGLKHKGATVGIVVALFVGVVAGLMPQLSVAFFPYAEKDFFYIDIHAEKSGDIEATQALAKSVTAVLHKQAGITDTVVAIGDGMPKFYITMKPPMPSADNAQMIVKYDLKKAGKHVDELTFANHIQKVLDESVTSGNCKVRLLENAFPSDAKVVVRVTGDHLDRIQAVSKALKLSLENSPEVIHVRDDWQNSVFELQVNVDEDKASQFGISKYDVQKEINLALYGNDATVYRKEGKAYDIHVKGRLYDAATLENISIKSSITGNKIPLKEIATIGQGHEINTLNTYNRKLSIEVLADPSEGTDATHVEQLIEKTILPKIDTSGTVIHFAGEREDIAKNFKVLGILAVGAVAVIYVVLLLQFNSFIQPFVILTTIPMSLIGSITGLFLLRQPLSMTALLGIISLIGLVVKNGVLLIDYINEARAAGVPTEAACIDAVGKRINAVILSALTVILALIPLAFSGSSLFGPMAVALMSGLTVSTFLTMVVVPVLYSLTAKE